MTLADTKQLCVQSSMTTKSNGNHAPSTGTGIYVDTENLREPDLAQDVIEQTIANWPVEYPAISSVSLYVRADKVALWRMWVEASYPDLKVRVRGVQHFSREMAKNSADLAITADAIGDLAAGLATFVGVISNDSDFGALFVKVREMAQETDSAQLPFLWITAPGGGGISPEIERFIPDRFRWNLAMPAQQNPGTFRAPSATRTPTPGSVAQPIRTTAPTRTTASVQTTTANQVAAPAQKPPAASPTPGPTIGTATPAGTATPELPSNPQINADEIADELIRQLPVGRFRAGEAQKVVNRRWPNHPSAGSAAHFGQFLSKELWPILQRRGVTMPRNNTPRIYEITVAAKSGGVEPEQPASGSTTEAAAPSPRRQPNRERSGGEPTLEQLVAEVADSIPDDVFKASEAQAAIAARWPAHMTASFSAQRFGMWFAEHLWPLMEGEGVLIASEKPRRYEMTPDSRHRLISQTSS